MTYDRDKINEIRMLPMSKDIFPTYGEATTFLTKIIFEQDGIYYHGKQKMKCDSDTLVLFQFDNSLIGSALLVENLEDENYYRFDLNSIKILHIPIYADEFKHIDSSFIKFGQGTQIVDIALLERVCDRIENGPQPRNLNNKQKEVAEQLLLSIKGHESNVTYKDLSERTASKPNPHTEMPGILYEIGQLCYELSLPFITFLVINSKSKIPGDGCMALSDLYHLGWRKEDIKTYYNTERDRIRNCREWQKLADYLELDIVMPIVDERVFPDEISKEMELLLTEGGKKRVVVNAYERDPFARRKCIEHYGAKCQICGFDFSKMYGQEYAGLIHVHHIKPLHLIGRTYEVDPIKDLIPVCPNCHMALHSSVGDSVEALKEKVRK